jgi:hypothetical protein
MLTRQVTRVLEGDQVARYKSNQETTNERIGSVCDLLFMHFLTTITVMCRPALRLPFACVYHPKY